MAHISLPEKLPGILGPMAFRPEAARALGALAETILRGPASLSSAERELIASVVSRANACLFCCESHSAAARHHYGPQAGVVDDALRSVDGADLSPKMKALLHVAVKVAKGGKHVESQDITKAAGANDQDIHDTVLIAAAFCMFNRYVDGLGTWAPEAGHPAYADMGRRLATEGYEKP